MALLLMHSIQLTIKQILEVLNLKSLKNIFYSDGMESISTNNRQPSIS